MLAASTTTAVSIRARTLPARRAILLPARRPGPAPVPETPLADVREQVAHVARVHLPAQARVVDEALAVLPAAHEARLLLAHGRVLVVEDGREHALGVHELLADRERGEVLAGRWWVAWVGARLAPSELVRWSRVVRVKVVLYLYDSAIEFSELKQIQISLP